MTQARKGSGEASGCGYHDDDFMFDGDSAVCYSYGGASGAGYASSTSQGAGTGKIRRDTNTRDYGCGCNMGAGIFGSRVGGRG
jgi:hypothetical protein